MQTSIFKHLTMVEFGVGAVEKVGEKVKELLGSKALIVTDPGLIAAGVIDTVEGYLHDAGTVSYTHLFISYLFAQYFYLVRNKIFHIPVCLRATSLKDKFAKFILAWELLKSCRTL